LPFTDRGWKSERNEAPALAIPEGDEPYTLGEDDRFDVGEDSPESNEIAPEDDEPALDLTDDFGNDDESEWRADGSGANEGDGAKGRSREGVMVLTILVALGVTLLAYGALTAAFFAAPAWCDEVVGKLWFVSGQGNERLLTRKIMLEDVTGTHQSIKDAKHVFVIHGKAYNTAAESLQNVQIVGTLYDAHGKEVGRKTIHLGNVVSTKVLAEMTRKEIEVFHGLNMSWRNIEPGQTYPFVIVFPDPPKSAIDFTTRVSGAFRPRG